MVASLARGRTLIRNFATSADCASTLSVLEGLGVRVERGGGSSATTVSIEGAGAADDGAPQFRAPARTLDCGNSGTTMRLVAGLLAAQPFASTLAGDDSLSGRPMRRIIEPLEMMGARVAAVGGHAPLIVEGHRPLRAVDYAPQVASAQVKSCVLLAGLGAEGRTRVVERGGRTRDHTERMLEWFGASVEVSGAGVGEDLDDSSSASVEGFQNLEARDVSVPGDISSAAFLLAGAALLRGSEVAVEGVGLNPTRARIVTTLERLGADVRVESAGEESNEPAGDVSARGAGPLAPRAAGAVVLRGHEVAQLIDELPVLAVVGTRIEGGLEIRDARELRVKESDRVSAVVEICG
jgi:3-phosphoshikimate 1-carboxyvinyltransferase